MKILFENLTGLYGEDKGIYVQVAEISKIPNLFLRDGRLVAVLDAAV